MAVAPALEEEMDLVQGAGYSAVGSEVPESSMRILVGDKSPPRRFMARCAVAALGMLIVTVGIGILSTRRSPIGTRGALQSHLDATISEVAWVGVPPCGLMERGIEYTTKGGEVGQYPAVDYDTLCRHKCFLVAECQIWTWTPDKICRLLTLNQDEVPAKQMHAGATSGGMPCGMDQMLASGTLYCWALMQPNSYETGLLVDQYNKHIGIFNCEEHAIVSNIRVQVVPGYWTQVVNTTLSCQSGGEFGTALNLYIFIAVWNRIVEIGTFRAHDWTVKCDPDAVFFADRLRGLLPHHPPEAKGVYLNNCKFGMHGPIEVFSRDAVTALTGNWESCKTYFTQLCHGDCQWGEDMFIDQCLWKVARARRDTEWSLLVEDHCLSADPGENGPWSFAKCDGTHVAFHPFKDIASYSQCFSNAWALADQANKEQNQDVPPPL